MDETHRGFCEALEAEIRRAAVEENRHDINREDIEKLGRSVGITEEEAVHQFLFLAGRSWAGEIMLGSEQPIMRLDSPPRERAIEPEWKATFFDRAWMERRGKIPSYRDRLGG